MRYKRNNRNQKTLIYICLVLILAIAIGILFLAVNDNVNSLSASNSRKVTITQIEEKPLSMKSLIVEYRLNQLQSKLNALNADIVCWGDSLTEGANCDTNYPEILQSLIQERLLDTTDLHNFFEDDYEDIINNYRFSFAPVNVINLGVGGETSATIAGRNGAIDMVVAYTFTIPSGTESVPISLDSISGGNVQPIRNGDGGTNPVTINGIEGTLSVDQENAFSNQYQYYFTRNKAGKETTVEIGSTVHSYCEDKYLDDMMIIFMGTNGGYDNIDDLVEQHWSMIHQQNNKNYIILGMQHGNPDFLNEVDDAMEAAFGDHYISLHEFFTTSNLAEYGYELSLEDMAEQSEGYCPGIVLLDDGLHFNEKGYTIIADLIYKRMDSLGYFDSIKEILKLS